MDKNGSFWLNKASALLDQKKDRSLSHELYRFWIAEHKVNTQKTKRARDEYIGLMEQSLDDFYYINRLRLYCEKINRQKITEIDHGVEKLLGTPNIVWSVKEKRLYYQLVKLLTEQDVQAYLYIDEFVKNHQNYFAKKYLREFIEYLMNFCIRKVNQHNKEYARDYLNLIELLQKENLLLQGGELSLSRFRNTMAAGIVAENLDWVKSFVNNYKNAIGLDRKTNKKTFLKFYRGLIALYSGDLTNSWKL